MGADANLFVFDYAKYRAEVVPGFAALLRDGVAAEWMLEVQRREREAVGLEDYRAAISEVMGAVDLGAHCSYLGEDWSVAGPVAGSRNLYELGWETRACWSESCAARGRCPFHCSAGTAVEDLLFWFQKSVAVRCLGEGQFLGRSVDCYFYWEGLEELGAPTRVRELLELLGRRGFMVGYRWVVGTDGIHGWLDPEETQELGERLFALDLPDYECSFAAMRGFQTMRNLAEGTGREFLWPAYEHPEYSFERLSLSYVRTVCQLAAREGKGVLWGSGGVAPLPGVG
jgi:hypothetical protein